MLPLKTMNSLLEKIQNRVDSNKFADDVYGATERSYYLKLQYTGDGVSCYSLYHYGTMILTIRRHRIDIDKIEHLTMAWIYSASDQNAINALLKTMGIKEWYSRQGLSTQREEI